MREIRVQGVLVGPRSTFEALVAFCEQSALRPVVDRVFALEDYRAAFERQAGSDAFGKVCVRVSTGA
jgi:NADPH:quinone reductase-like Zn-dependent oxidoreductase